MESGPDAGLVTLELDALEVADKTCGPLLLTLETVEEKCDPLCLLGGEE